MFEFDYNKAYRLIDVRDHEGSSKAESEDLYRERVGCLAREVRTGMTFDGNPPVYMQFIQDKDGNWINLRLRTSRASDILEKDGLIEIHTENSVYVMEEAQMKQPEFLDEAEVIELYMGSGGFNFCAGYYYDADNQPHELMNSIHAGTIQDSCLIMPRDQMGNIVCRYFPHRYSIEFYQTLYRQQDYSRRLLIHNVGEDYLTVSFSRFKADWRIAPGDSRWITPYDKTGADETYEDEEE